LPKEYQGLIKYVEVKGRTKIALKNKISEYIPNPTFDVLAAPGVHEMFMRGKNPEGLSMRELTGDVVPCMPGWRTGDERLKLLDKQGVHATLMFPTLASVVEERMRHDHELLNAVLHALNEWLHVHWGFAREGRIFAVPFISLMDLDMALTELEWALARGARTVALRPAPVPGYRGGRSPGAEEFDPFWARVNEAGICVVIHAGDSGYTTHRYVRDGFSAAGLGGPMMPNIKHFNIERAAYDFLITIAYERLFERFPNLRIASIENGAEFLPDLFRKLRQSRDRLDVVNYYKEDPALLFKEHVWINPFWEDDVYQVEEQMGADRVIFGSDWPHIEGMPEPLDYVTELSKFDDAKKQLILRDNTRSLNERRPA